MLGSTVIEINGIFLGVAILVSATGARRFYAAHDSVRGLHNQTLTDLSALRRLVSQHARAVLRPI